MPYDNTTFAYNGRVDDNDLRDPQIARIIAARFKESKRKHKTLTQETNQDIARICGMSDSLLGGYLYCAPPVKLTVDRYTMLARYFGESPDHMLEMPDEWQLVDEAANDDQCNLPPVEPLLNEEYFRQNDMVGLLNEAFTARGEAHGLSQRQMAAEMGWSPGSLNQYLLGNAEINYTALFKMCRYLGISPLDIDVTLSDVIGVRKSDLWQDQDIIDLISERAPHMSQAAKAIITKELMQVGWGFEGQDTDALTLAEWD